MDASEGAKPQPPQQQVSEEMYYAESLMNLTLADPPRWGWTPVGGITDLLSPHEVGLIPRCQGL
jgi:hypothetical protein